MVVSAKEILAEAEALRETMISDRRTLHAAPEAGADLPRTREYVAGRLREMGYEPKELAGGITAEITGSDTGACVLLRADMDALCVTEQTDLPFRSQNGCMHACGHDMHTAMLLGAAKLLRGYQSKLNGTVKLVFQPDEEGFTGAKAMLAAGVLREPAPQAGFALHVHSGTPSGLVLCGEGTFMAGCTLFRVTVHGTGCHGAMPETGVDPIHIAANIYLALEELVAREVAAKQPAVITVGRFTGGDAPNIIPSSAILEGTIRTFDRELSACLLRRIGELAQGIAAAYRGTAEVCELASAPPLKNDDIALDLSTACAKELFGDASVYRLRDGGMGSEDFASYTYELPCAYLLLGAVGSYLNREIGRLIQIIILLLIVCIVYKLANLIFTSISLVSRLPLIRSADKLFGAVFGILEGIIITGYILYWLKNWGLSVLG